jgi:hypothetical protein
VPVDESGAPARIVRFFVANGVGTVLTTRTTVPVRRRRSGSSS